MDTSATPPVSSAPEGGAASGPTAKTLLRAIAGAAPQLWFPATYAALSGWPRDQIDEPLWLLRQSGMVQVADWVAGVGQGFLLTRAGEQAAELDGPLVPAAVKPDPAPPSEPRLAPARPTVVAPALLLINVVWFAAGLFVAWKAGVGMEFLKGDGHLASNQVLVRIGALSGSHLLLGEYWRLLTCCFVHVGLFHLFGNMLMLGILGPVSEGLWGRWRFALIYLAAGLAGSAAAMALNPMAETANGARETLLAGASGALWGVLLSVVVWLIRYRDKLPEGVAKEWGRKLAFAVLFNLMLSFAPGISLEAHLGGGFAGIALAYWLDRRRWPQRIVSLLGVVVLAAVLIGGLVSFVRYSDEWKLLRQIHALRQMFAPTHRP